MTTIDFRKAVKAQARAKKAEEKMAARLKALKGGGKAADQIFAQSKELTLTRRRREAR